MIKYLLYILLLLSAFLGCTQRFSSEVFHQGYLVTNQKDSLKGKLKYDLEANIVTLIVGDKTLSYSSQKVFYFEIFDAILNNYRQFYSIPHTVNYGYKIPILFEVIYEGKTSLLRRERIVLRTVTTNFAYAGVGNVQNVIEYSYYFLDDRGEISFFSGKKKDLLKYMSDKQSDIKQFIKQNKLSTDQASDLVRITAFYNSI
ncbi:MAG: hypothetical protein OXH57_09625 [Ekhidna sp.]|nr:hypothetical protein [Ekhidna sp.]